MYALRALGSFIAGHCCVEPRRIKESTPCKLVRFTFAAEFGSVETTGMKPEGVAIVVVPEVRVVTTVVEAAMVLMNGGAVKMLVVTTVLVVEKVSLCKVKK